MPKHTKINFQLKKKPKKDSYNLNGFTNYHQTFSIRTILAMMKNKGEISQNTWIDDPKLQYGED